jgi:hypothetical protein
MKKSFAALAPEAAGVAWMIALALGIWLHTSATQQTPIFDAFSYFEKAYRFWAGVASGHWINPFNVPNSFRPPGTILMSYPFGFTPNPEWFYFRSVYLPAILLFLSPIVTVYKANDDKITRWMIVATAALFTTVTTLYQFEFGAGRWVYWGLVDGFLAGLAAFAAACSWRASQSSRKRWIWALLTAVASCVALTVKPSGVFVAALAGIGYSIFSLIRWINFPTKKFAIESILFGVFIAALDSITLYVALHSDYLSSSNMKAGLDAIAVMKAELKLPISILWDIISTGIGPGLLAWTVAALALITARVITNTRPLAESVAALVAVGVLVFGIYYWIVATGGTTQFRYGLPFFMMTLVWLTPILYVSVRGSSFLARLTVTAISFAVPLNLALMLFIPTSAGTWQRLSGVGLASSVPASDVLMLKEFFLRPRSTPIIIYTLTGNFPSTANFESAILESYGYFSALLEPTSPILTFRRAYDWQRRSTYRLDEILSSTHILVDPSQTRSIGESIDSVSDEEVALTRWMLGLRVSDGVDVVLDTPHLRIYKVINGDALRNKVFDVVRQFQWNPIFRDANLSYF